MPDFYSSVKLSAFEMVGNGSILKISTNLQNVTKFSMQHVEIMSI